MADGARESLLRERPPARPTRHQAVTRVLARVLVLNLAVACAKLVFGYATGAVSIVSDGFHSLTDSAVNVIGLVGLRAARKPPDADHPYGHRKFETLAAAGIFVFMLLAVFEIGRAALTHFASAGHARVTPLTFVVMIGTLAVNLGWCATSGRGAAAPTASCCSPTRVAHAQRRLRDDRRARSRSPASPRAIPSWIRSAGSSIAVLIARTGFEIARDTSGILSDRVVIDEDDIRQVVMSVPACSAAIASARADRSITSSSICTSGSPPTRGSREAHAVSHVVKDRLMAALPADRGRDHPHRAAAVGAL